MSARVEPASEPGFLKRHIPILHWLPGYSAANLRPDLVAGLVAAAVVVPQAMAYASIAGLPVEVGLYTALGPMLVYALLGSSRVLSVSTTSTIAMLTASALALPALSGAGGASAAATLALLTGAFLVVAALLRLGFIANFISTPVLVGFKAGIGIVIFVGQLGKVLGIATSGDGFFRNLGSLLANLDQISWPTTLVSLITVAVLVGLPRLAPRVPAPLVAVALGIAASAVFDLSALGVALVGEIEPGLPALAMPDLSLIRALWPAALGIALMSFTESIAAGRTFAAKDDPPVDADQELLALGLANVAGGFGQAMPAGGGTSQTAVNRSSGAVTQLSTIATAVIVLLTLLFLSGLIALMPEATLGALVMVAAIGLVKPAEFRRIARIQPVAAVWALVSAAGVIVLGTLEGIVIAVVISMLTLIHEANHPPVYALGHKPGTDVFRPLGEHEGDVAVPGLLIVRTEGRMHFASAPRLTEKLRQLIVESAPEVVIFDGSAVPAVEYTALQMLIDWRQKLADAGIELWLAAMNPEALETIRRATQYDETAAWRLFPTVLLAVEAYEATRPNA